MRSFSILRTNVGLTTNTKVMVTNQYDLFLESIDSSPELSNTRYKKFRFNKDNFYDELLPYFYKSTPMDIAFRVKYDDDNDNMFTDFERQYDDVYYMGCRNIVNNKNYTQEYECFAPLYIHKGSLPKFFIIFRVDGSGLVNLNKENFKNEIIDKLKCVQNFNLTGETPLGEWLNRNFINNEMFPSSPLYVDYRSSEFSSWNGIDMTSGGYINRSFFLDSTFEYENLYFDLQKAIYDGYKNNSVAFANILNLSFLFDDTPATPNSLRKWSLNRYMGFYFDELESTIGVSVYVPPKLKSDVFIDSGNILKSRSSSSPFDETWKKVEVEYIEIDGSFYKLQRFQESTGSSLNRVRTSSNTFEDQVSENFETFYKIISEKDFSGLTLSSINQNIVSITSENKLIKVDSGDYQIDDFDTADLWLIEIDGKFHVLTKRDNSIYIQTDYAFEITPDRFDYYINFPDPNFRKSISLVVDQNSEPKVFKIYKCVFTDIKDFDTRIIDTDYSKFEYQSKLDLTQTDETKMYCIDYKSTSNPKDIEDYKINGQVVNIPASSEYTANGETFRIVDNDLTSLWRKNTVFVKWAFQGSLSSNDYPYLMNNAFASEDFNRTVNPFDPNPKRIERNLDYFYTINSSTSSYSHHSLHVENLEVQNFKFDFEKYLNLSGYNEDYFTQFFGQNAKFESGDVIRKTQKWSEFNPGDAVIPNITLFRGIKFKIFDVESIKVDNGNIKNINVRTNNQYDGYKFSILLSKNDQSLVVDPGDSVTLIELTSSVNSLEWKIIDSFKYDKPYSTGDIVNYESVLYRANTNVTISDPNLNPGVVSSWQYFTHSIFWSPGNIYDSSSDPVYYAGEYYQRIGSNDLVNVSGSFIPVSLDSPSPGDFSFLSLSGFQVGDTIKITQPPITYYATVKSSTSTNLGFFSVVVEPINGLATLDPITQVQIVSDDYNFWIPGKSYSIGKNVIYRSNIYTSLVNNNIESPTNFQFWSKSSGQSDKWSKIELWSNLKTYNSDNYVVHNDVLYKSLISNLSLIEPGFDDTKWLRIYSMVPDTNYFYTSTDNQVILLNNRFYLCTSTSKLSTLDDGIVVYVNKKWKNILINIYVNDNTLPNLSNADRDLIYNDLYSKLTANNFMNCLNVLSNKYGFVDFVKYVIIDETTTKVYSYNTIGSLPVMITAEPPDQFLSRISSLDKFAKTLNVNQFKSKRKLEKANIETIDMLNWYNDSLSLGTEINRVKGDPQIIPYYSGLSNNIYNNMYRHSGYYGPIFYNIELFAQGTNSSGQICNYKFDTSLTDFGLAKQQVISKVNRNSNILQLRNRPDLKSIWPMIDEFGYTLIDFFIFKSTWDFEYHVECLEIKQVPPPIANKALKVNFIDKNSLL